MKDIILASSSPRRREIMNKLRLSYKVVISNVSEKMDPSLSLKERVMDLAEQKAAAVFAENRDSLVLGADTIVEIDGEVLGKPHGRSEAREMLKKLSGRTHRVITAYAIMHDDELIRDYDEAFVTFVKMDDAEIERYINTREPYDKAGGYAVQGLSSVFVEKIDGSFFTVMGLPLHRIYQEFKKLGLF